jgi:hypothetical protein
MRRVLLLTWVGLTLVCFPGCHHWKKKHLYRSAYVDGDACGCGSSIGGSSYVDGPAAYDNFVPGPPGPIISAPAKGPLPAAQF